MKLRENQRNESENGMKVKKGEARFIFLFIFLFSRVPRGNTALKQQPVMSQKRMDGGRRRKKKKGGRMDESISVLY